MVRSVESVHLEFDDHRHSVFNGKARTAAHSNRASRQHAGPVEISLRPSRLMRGRLNTTISRHVGENILNSIQLRFVRPI